MTGVDIVGTMLREDTAFAALVPEAQIKAGELPAGISLPAVLVRLVSSVDRQPLKRGTLVRVSDRVSVTVRAESYREQRTIIKRARAVCAGKIGAIGGGQNVSILTAGLGPDLRGPGNSFEQTQDFKVSHDTADA